MMKSIRNCRFGLLCLSFIFATACSTTAVDSTQRESYCENFSLFGSGEDAPAICVLGYAALIGVMLPVAKIENAINNHRHEKDLQKLRNDVEVGDLAVSERCVLGVCDFLYLSNTRRRAAENVLDAYQDEQEPGREKQLLLISAHRTMAEALEDESPENQRGHLKAVVQFGESQALWDYVNDPSFRQYTPRKEIFRSEFERAQKELNESVIDLLIIDQGIRVADDPYHPFACNLAPYQKAIDLSIIENYELERIMPCKDAERKRERQAIKYLKGRLESGDLAAAERCVLECEKIREDTYFDGRTWDAEELRRLSAKLIIDAYGNRLDLDSRQQGVLKESQALSLKRPD